VENEGKFVVVNMMQDEAKYHVTTKVKHGNNKKKHG
jgi:hypothetical protein